MDFNHNETQEFRDVAQTGKTCKFDESVRKKH